MKKKSLLIITLIFALILVSLIIGYQYLNNFAKQPINLQESTQLFTLERGKSVKQLIRQIEDEKLIDNAYLITYLLKVRPSLQHIKSGTYQLTPNMTVEDFLKLLNSGKEVQYAIRFVEGKTAKDWLQVLANTDHVDHQIQQLSQAEIAKKLGLESSLEGWLFPETYHFGNNTSDLAILKRAYNNMQRVLQIEWDNRDDDLPYKTPYEMLIMASIIEKETGVDDERNKVASVFINRLKYKMLLQTDPTVIYGMGDEYKGNILTKHLKDKTNPYNTYVISGLPPTPIAMPSLASIIAAAHPAQTNYLYFVANGKGGHVFSTNYQDHQRAVNDYWRLMRGR
ncbi:endolytic transglycosylase MltG [Orbaceae bacterium ac157xtp]